jgi:hypothetical protein
LTSNTASLASEISSFTPVTAVFEIRENEVLVCTTCQNDCKPVENILEKTVVEDEIRLDDTSKNVLMLDEWAEQKVILFDFKHSQFSFRDIFFYTCKGDRTIFLANIIGKIWCYILQLIKFIFF